MGAAVVAGSYTVASVLWIILSDRLVAMLAWGNVETLQMLQRYKDTYGEEPSNALFYVGYSTIELLARAIERAGSTDAEAVRAAIESFENEPLLVGETTYTPDCHIPLGRGKVITRAEGDQAVFVEYITPTEVDRSRC